LIDSHKEQKHNIRVREGMFSVRTVLQACSRNVHNKLLERGPFPERFVTVSRSLVRACAHRKTSPQTVPHQFFNVLIFRRLPGLFGRSDITVQGAGGQCTAVKGCLTLRLEHALLSKVALVSPLSFDRLSSWSEMRSASLCGFFFRCSGNSQ
jgi:hypothetical protein